MKLNTSNNIIALIAGTGWRTSTGRRILRIATGSKFHWCLQWSRLQNNVLWYDLIVIIPRKLTNNSTGPWITLNLTKLVIRLGLID